jgi:hypothetical protein
MTSQSMRATADRLRAIPLTDVLRVAGAKPDHHDKHRWHTTRGAISVSGMKFMNWNLAKGGGGAIDLIIHLRELDFKNAIEWLCRHFPEAATVPPPCVADPQMLKLPAPNDNKLVFVKRYLTATRRIQPELVERIISIGDLQADNHANAVFIMRSDLQIPVGAELRGTGTRTWRGMAPGSRKNLGYFSCRNAQTKGIVLCESAIDALSCLILHPELWCISTAGARPSPSWLPKLLQTDMPVLCGFDADPTGDECASEMIRQHPRAGRMRPSKHDWNEVLANRF